MNCKFCGAPVGDNDVLCPHCGCSLEELIPLDEEVVESVMPDETAAIQQDVIAEEDVQTPFVDLNTEGTMPAPKKSKVGKIILFGIIGLLAIGIILLACNFSSAYSWFKIKTSSGRELLKTSFEKSIEEFADSYEDYAEDLAEMGDASRWGMQTQASLELNDQIVSVLDEAMAQQGMDMNLSWLQGLNLDVKMLFDGEASTGMIAYAFGMGGEQLICVEGIIDQPNNKEWFACPGLIDTPAYATLSDDKAGQSFMDSMLGRMNQNANAYSSEKLEKFLKKYCNVLLDGFGKVKKSSETIEIDGISQKLTVLDAYMSEENAINMCIAVLETAKNDQDLKQVILQFGQQIAADMPVFDEDEPYSAEDLYNEFLVSIDGQLEELRAELNNLDMTEEICLTFYMDNDFQIAGCKVTDVDGEELFRYVGVEEKDRYAAEFVAGEVVITDSGKDQKENEGTLSLCVSGADLLTADHKTTEKDDVIKTNVKLKLGSDLIQQITAQMGDNAAMVYMSTIAIEFDVTASGKQTDCQISLTMMGQKLISLNLEQAFLRDVEITVPTDGINVDDPEQFDNWLDSLDYEGLMNKLEAMGLSEEMLESLMG